jgi:hypothetical protein
MSGMPQEGLHQGGAYSRNVEAFQISVNPNREYSQSWPAQANDVVAKGVSGRKAF